MRMPSIRKGILMFRTQIIEIDSVAVGLAIGDETGVIFFSSGGLFDALDAQTYPDFAALERSVRRHFQKARPSARGDIRQSSARSVPHTLVA